MSLAEEFGAEDDDAQKRIVETMKRTTRRFPRVFTKITGGTDGIHRIALLSNRTEAA